MEHTALPLLPVVDSLDVRLRLREEELVKVPVAGDPTRQFLDNLWELPVFTAVRARIFSGDPEQLEQAGNHLDICREENQIRRHNRQLIELGILSALHKIALEDTDAALAALEEAVARARSGGVIRMFVDEGPGLRPYLKTLVTRNSDRTHINRILAAYEPGRLARPAGAAAGRPALAAELTFREAESCHSLCST